MPANTPGPWHYHKRGIDYLIHAGHETGFDLATVREGGDGQGAQNARLIAAAPLLLEACEMSLALSTNANTYEPIDVVRKLIEALTAAGYDKNELDRCAMSLLRQAMTGK